MVKGISRQVIVVHGAGEGLFDQAIFILKDSAVEKCVTDEALLKEARQTIRGGDTPGKMGIFPGALWACGGALATGMLWVITLLL